MISDEVTILEATAATETQTSDEFVLPASASRFLLYLDVTAGAALALDMELQVYLPGPDSWAIVITDLPAAGNITAVSLTTVILGAATADIDSGIVDKKVPIGGKLRVVVAHGNANEATYDVYFQPV